MYTVWLVDCNFSYCIQVLVKLCVVYYVRMCVVINFVVLISRTASYQELVSTLYCTHTCIIIIHVCVYMCGVFFIAVYKVSLVGVTTGCVLQ